MHNQPSIWSSVHMMNIVDNEEKGSWNGKHNCDKNTEKFIQLTMQGMMEVEWY